MIKLRNKLNNKGETFVMVLVTTLFVAILATIVIIITRYALKNYQLRKQGTDSFYSAEKALNEFESSLRSTTNEAFGKAYTIWLQQYSSLTGEKSEEKFFELFRDYFTESITDKVLKLFDDNELVSGNHKINDPVGTGGLMLSYKEFYKDDVKDDGSGVVLPVGERYVIYMEPPTIRTDANGKIQIADGRVGIENIKIMYVAPDGTAKKIETDISIKVDYPGLLGDRSTGTFNEFCSDYIFISDGEIKNDAGLKAEIDGNVYAGTGINFAGFGGAGNTIVESNKNNTNFISNVQRVIISRAALTVSNKAEVIISTGCDYRDGATLAASVFADYSDRTGVWVKDIIIDDSSSNSVNTKLDITGSCFVADNLELNAAYSYFKMHSGNGLSSKFIGYSMTNKINGIPQAVGSSAIVVNGANSTLDLTEANAVVVAGKTFISFPENTEYEGVKGQYSSQMGESATFKALQSAYLVPGELLSVGHNPVTAEEFYAGIDVDMSKRAVSGLRMSNYVDMSTSTSGYRTFVVRYGATTMVYYYLNFRNPNKAAEYFRDYFTRFPDLNNDRMQQFGSAGKLAFNYAKMISTGNIIGYENGQMTVNGTLDPNGDSAYQTNTYNDDDLDDLQIKYSSMFAGLCGKLDPDYSGTSGKSLTAQVVNFESVKNLYDVDVVGSTVSVESQGSGLSIMTIENVFNSQNLTSPVRFVDVPGTNECYLVIIGKNVTISQLVSAYNGRNVRGVIVVSKGNVTLNAVSINGMIIAGGDIILRGNSTTYKADPATVNNLIANDFFVNSLFSVGSIHGTIDGSDFITVDHENWKK